MENTMPKDSPLYVALVLDRFLGGVHGMTTEEVGAYTLLLVEQAVKGYIPNNQRRLAAIARMDPGGFETAWKEALSSKFEAVSPDDPTRLVNPRMAQERKTAMAQSGKQSQRARDGWKTRRGSAAADAAACAGAMPPQTQTQRDPTGLKGGAARPTPLDAALTQLEMEGRPVSPDVRALLQERYEHCRESTELPTPGRSGWRTLALRWADDPEGLRRAVAHSVQYKSLCDPQARAGATKESRDEKLAKFARGEEVTW